MGGIQSFPADKHVVVIGAGYAGVELAVQMQKLGGNFTLIDVKDCFYHNNAAVRATSEEGWVKKLFIPYDKKFGERFKQGKVVHIDTAKKVVVLESGENISYHVVVIATGCHGDLPFKMGVNTTRAEVEQLCADTLEKLHSAKKVVVIGGGGVGVEVAAEIATDYKDIEVTLVHSSDKLISNAKALTDKFHQVLKEKLEDKGVKIILGEKVENLPETGVAGPCEVSTDKGTSISADLVFKCIGLHTNTDAYASSLSDFMDSTGQLKVNKYFQLEGYPNIFAIGDATNIKEFKLANRAEQHAQIAVKNIRVVLVGGGEMEKYDPGRQDILMSLSIGRKDGISLMPNGTIIPTFAVVLFKSKDLTLSDQYKSLSQPKPK